MSSLLTRRRFLQCGAAAAFLATPAARAWGLADGKPASPGITLGFSTYAMKSLEPIAAIEAIAKIGYHAVEICCLADFPADPAKLDAAARGALRKSLATTRLHLPALMENLPL